MRIGMLLAVALCLLIPDLAFAGSSGGGNMPWEGPLDIIQQSITGPVAYAVALIGITVAGLLLLWGGEIGEFTRRVIMLTLVISLVFGAATLLSNLVGVGAVIQ